MALKKENIISYISYFIIILFFIIIFFHCNVINSGYKLIDDHEIYYFSSIINKENILELFTKLLREDGRFRPVYWIHRLLLFSSFKANFFLYYFEYFIFSILSSVLFFKILNKFIHAIPSLLIVAFTFLSCEFQIYLGLGMGELFSCTLLILSLYFIVFANEKNKKISNILSFIFLLLAAYSKETFLIAIPFILLFKILYESKCTNIKETINHNVIYIIATMVFTILGCLLNIILDNSSGNYTILFNPKEITNILIDILISVKHITNEYLVLFLFSIIVFFNLKQIKDKKIYLICLIGSLLFLFSQLTFLSLFSTDNPFQIRYLYPALFSSAILCTTIIFFTNNKILKLTINLFLILSISYNANINSLEMLKHNANSNIVFNKTLEYTRNILKENDSILLIGDAVHTMEYFESLFRNYTYHNIKNVYFLPLIDRPTEKLNEFETNLVNFFPQYYPNNLYNDKIIEPKVIIVFQCPNKEIYKKQSNINFEKYKKIPIEYYFLEFYEKKL